MITDTKTAQSRNGSVREAALRTIASAVCPEDKKEFLCLFPRQADRFRDGARKNGTLKNTQLAMTVEQRMLLATYIHLYLFLKSRKIQADQTCKSVRTALGLSDDFVLLLQQALRCLPKAQIPDQISPLRLMINPPDYVINWATSVVLLARKGSQVAEKVRLPKLNSKEYEHPRDRQMLEMLRNTKGFDTLVRKFYEHGLEPLLRVRYTGSNLKVTSSNFPDLYDDLTTACEVLGIKDVPDLYLQQGFINAKTAGIQKPIIALDFGCINLLSRDERMFILGHELGHIKSEHLLYHQMGMVLPILGDVLGQLTLGFGKLLETGVSVALLNWQRMSEFTADRAGLLCCQNLDAACKVMMKIAGGPPRYYPELQVRHFMDQAKEFKDFDLLTQNKVAKVLSTLWSDHPWTVMRGAELLKWVDAGSYKSLLNRS